MELTEMLAEREEGLKNMDSLTGSRSGEKRDERAVWETLEKSIHIPQPPSLFVLSDQLLIAEKMCEPPSKFASDPWKRKIIHTH